jgi:hypothetical protein
LKNYGIIKNSGFFMRKILPGFYEYPSNPYEWKKNPDE